MSVRGLDKVVYVGAIVCIKGFNKLYSVFSQKFSKLWEHVHCLDLWPSVVWLDLFDISALCSLLHLLKELHFYPLVWLYCF